MLRHIVHSSILLVVALAACAAPPPAPTGDNAPRQWRIGMSQANNAEPWRQAMNEQIAAAAARYPQIQVEFTDARQNNAQQVADVEEFLSKGIDLLIISPNEATPLTNAVAKAYQRGIPVIVLDRKVRGDQYTMWIGADNRLIGRKAGEYTARWCREQQRSPCNVIELRGLEGSTPAQERGDGFREGIAGNPDVQIIASQNADWLAERAEGLSRVMFDANPAVDVVYAHNDPMAIASFNVARDQGRDIDAILFIGIDALPTPDGGIQAVRRGTLDVTYVYPTGGAEAIEWAIRILEQRETPPREVVLDTEEVTGANADAMWQKIWRSVTMRSVQTIWLGILLLFALLPMIVVGGVLSWLSRDLQTRQALSIQHEITERAEALLANFVEEALQEANILVRTPGFVNGSPEQRQELLSQAIFERNLFDSLAVVDATGREQMNVSRIGATRPDQLTNRASDPLFRVVVSTERPAFGKIRLNPVNGELLLPIALPYRFPGDATTTGILFADVRMSQVIEQVVNIPVGVSGAVTLFDREGRVIAHRNRDLIGQTATLPAVAGEPQTLTGVGGEPVLMSLRDVATGDNTLRIAVEQPLDEVYQPFVQNLQIIATLVALTAAAAVAGSVSTVQIITRPILNLARISEAISAGDLSQRIPVTRRDEIGLLQQNFNRMAENILAQQTALTARNVELEQNIQAQRRLFETVQQLSTPLLPVWEGVVVMPIVGHVDAARGQAILDALLHGIAERRARCAILDITGIAVVDTSVIAILTRAMQAAALIGATPMLAGISATTAHLMVQQGIADLHVQTYRNLQSAIMAAIEQNRSNHVSTVRNGSQMRMG
jgi:ribose transport system substrate-binding protein